MASKTTFRSVEIAPAVTRSITSGSHGATNIDVTWTPVMDTKYWTWVVFRHESSIPGDIFVATAAGGKRSTAIVVPRGESLPGMLLAPDTSVFGFSSIESRHLQVTATVIDVATLMNDFAGVLARAICDTLMARR